MTITAQRQMARGKAFNAIMRIHHPKANFHSDKYSDESYREQRDSSVQYIIEKYLKELEQIRLQNKTEQP